MTIYSHSRLSCFEQCPKKFKYKYIEKIRPELESGIEAFLGSRVHETLEKLYTDLKFQRTISLKDSLKYFNNIWEKNYNSNIVIVRQDYNQNNYRKMGEKFITDYYNRYKPFNQGRTISIEKRIVISLDKKGKYKLQGYIDRLNYKGKGIYEVHDYKTNSNLPMQVYLDKDRQLALYAIAIKNNYKDCKKVNLIWHFLAFDKELKSSRTNKQLNELKKETVNLIKNIEKEKKFRTKTGILCDWCEFKPMCPEWKHLYSTIELSPKKFKEEDGVKLVNRLATLKIAKTELEMEIKSVMQELTDYAKQLEVSVIFGSDAKASIKDYDSLSIPPKNSEERIKLEKLIKKYNKWVEVSSLDSAAIKNIIKEESWPKELIKKIKKFFKIETKKTLRVSRISKED